MPKYTDPTFSVARWREGDDISRLLSRADAALFQAKAQGRNRVVAALDWRGRRRLTDDEPMNSQ